MSRRSTLRGILATALRDSGKTVYESRVDDVPANKLPCITIYGTGVDSTPEPNNNGYIHNERFAVVCMVAGYDRKDRIPTGTQPVDELIDELEESVRTTLLSSTTRSLLGGNCLRIEYLGSNISPPPRDVESNTWFSNMSFQVIWLENLIG